MNDSSLQNELMYKRLLSSTRRQFLSQCSTGLGAIWLSVQAKAATANTMSTSPLAGLETNPSFQIPAKAKRVIFLHMIGAPSQLELFDYKPALEKLDGEECPQSFLEGKRFAFIQGTPRMLGHRYPFKQYGDCGAWVTDQLPHFAKKVDDVCFIKSMQTDQFNHGPAQLMVHTGQPRIGYPSIGSWVTYGLGTENENLPGFVVLLSGGRLPRVGKALWSGGFLPSVYQGVQCRSTGDPVLNISNPGGENRSSGMATRKRKLESRNTNLPIACRRKCPKRWISSRRPKRRSNCTVLSLASNRLPTTACLLDDLSKKAFALCSCLIGAGTRMDHQRANR